MVIVIIPSWSLTSIPIPDSWSPDHPDHLFQYRQELGEVVGLEEEVEDAVKDEVGGGVHVVAVGDRLPEDDGVVIHLPCRYLYWAAILIVLIIIIISNSPDGIAGSFEEWLEEKVASVARQQDACVSDRDDGGLVVSIMNYMNLMIFR